MHPFIPFVTEEIWLKNKLDKSGKNYLMFSNWINEKDIVLETLLSFKRAGAKLILTYHACDASQWLQDT